MTERTRACSSAMNSLHVIWRDEGHRAQGWIEPTVALKKVQVQTIAVGDVGLADAGKMTCRLHRAEAFAPACMLVPIRDDRPAAIPRSAAIVACLSWDAAPARRRLELAGGAHPCHVALRPEVQAPADDVGEYLARLRRLQA